MRLSSTKSAVIPNNRLSNGISMLARNEQNSLFSNAQIDQSNSLGVGLTCTGVPGSATLSKRSSNQSKI